jgi:hypothetical protein
MKISKKQLSILIERYLLKEEITGTKGIVYHGSSLEPDKFLLLLQQGKIGPTEGSVNAFGYGLYTFYNYDNVNHYGEYLYKLEVDLKGFICFTEDSCKEVYGKLLTPLNQLMECAKVYPHNKNKIQEMINFMLRGKDKTGESSESKFKFLNKPISEWDSALIRKFNSYANFVVPGIIFRDSEGPNCLIHDSRIVAPLAYQDAIIPRDKDGNISCIYDSKMIVRKKLDSEGNQVYETLPADPSIGQMEDEVYPATETVYDYYLVKGFPICYSANPEKMNPESPEYDQEYVNKNAYLLDKQSFYSPKMRKFDVNDMNRWKNIDDVDRSPLQRVSDPLTAPGSDLNLRGFGKPAKKDEMPHLFIPKR